MQTRRRNSSATSEVSVLFNEPKLLKCNAVRRRLLLQRRFSALQRAEIAEIARYCRVTRRRLSFSALQRAEIAEITASMRASLQRSVVSVLFNEPKLLKSKNSALEVENVKMFQCSSTSRNC